MTMPPSRLRPLRPANCGYRWNSSGTFRRYIEQIRPARRRYEMEIDRPEPMTTMEAQKRFSRHLFEARLVDHAKSRQPELSTAVQIRSEERRVGKEWRAQ